MPKCTKNLKLVWHNSIICGIKAISQLVLELRNDLGAWFWCFPVCPQLSPALPHYSGLFTNTHNTNVVFVIVLFSLLPHHHKVVVHTKHKLYFKSQSGHDHLMTQPTDSQATPAFQQQKLLGPRQALLSKQQKLLASSFAARCDSCLDGLARIVLRYALVPAKFCKIMSTTNAGMNVKRLVETLQHERFTVHSVSFGGAPLLTNLKHLKLSKPQDTVNKQWAHSLEHKRYSRPLHLWIRCFHYGLQIRIKMPASESNVQIQHDTPQKIQNI